MKRQSRYVSSIDSILNPDLAHAIATQDDAARDIRECDGALAVLDDILARLPKGDGTLTLACESGS